MMYRNEKLGIEIQNPSHSIWEGRWITSSELNFNDRAAKENNPMALMVKTASRFEFVKKIYASSGFCVNEPVVKFDLFMKAVPFRECDVYSLASENVKEKLDLLFVKMGRAVVKLEKSRAASESISIGWDQEEEDEPEVIRAIREEMEKADGFIKKNLETLESRVKKGDKFTEWLSIEELRNTPEWDDNVEKFFCAHFYGEEPDSIPAIVPEVVTPVGEQEDPDDAEDFSVPEEDCFVEEGDERIEGEVEDA